MSAVSAVAVSEGKFRRDIAFVLDLDRVDACRQPPDLVNELELLDERDERI